MYVSALLSCFWHVGCDDSVSFLCWTQAEEDEGRRRGRKRSPSAESDEGAIRAAGRGMPPLPPLNGPPPGEDEEMPDAA